MFVDSERMGLRLPQQQNVSPENSFSVSFKEHRILHEWYRQLASCLVYARALLEYDIVIFIMWVRSVTNVLPYVKFADDKVLAFLILREKCCSSAAGRPNLNPNPNFQSRLIR